jgi:hypothetical protein
LLVKLYAISPSSIEYHPIILVAVSIVDSYVDYMFLRSRPGGLANESKTQEVNMKINRFLALSGYLEGVVLSDMLLWMGHMEVHDSSSTPLTS